MNEFLKKLADIHDVVCPVCGGRASYVVTGAQSYQSVFCHKELERLIEDREQMLLTPSTPRMSCKVPGDR